MAVAILPDGGDAGGFLTGLGFRGLGWLAPLMIPPLAGVTAFFATRAAALRTLRTQS
jgi:cell division transport system permease protein